jgi:serine phosphatase RsbU (regulator of sigma subunit)
MDGLSMTKAIKAINRDTPVVLTTALNEAEYLLQAIGIGIDGYVLKPIRNDLLLEALNKGASTLYYRRELESKNQELQQYYDAAEREHQMIEQLMEHSVRNENLQDPLLHTWTAPATNFSGDLLTAQRAPNGDLYIILADATGHGLAAAVHLLPLSRIFYQMAGKCLSISSMLLEMNNIIREQSTVDRFVAATLVRVDISNHTFEVWNGGNPPAIWLGCDGEILRLFKSTNMALGIVENSMMGIHTEIIPWQTDAQLLLFSDGISEAENADGKPLGLDTLIASVTTQPHQERFTAVVRLVQDHLDGRPAHDDLSLIFVDCPAGEQLSPGAGI